MSLASAKASGLLYISSTISSTASSDPPNTSIVVLSSKAYLFLLMKCKSESISTKNIGTARYSIDAFKLEVSFIFSLRRGDGMNNVRKACQNGGFHFLYLEPIHHIKIIGDFCPRDRILVYDKLGTNHLQKDFFRRKRVNVVRAVIKV